MDLGKIKGVKFNSSSAFNNKNKKQDICSEINSPQAKYNTPSNPSYWQAFGNISPATEQKLISNEEFDFIFKPLKNTSENYIPDYAPFVEQTAVEVSKSSPQSLKNFVSILMKNQEYLHFNPIIKPSVFLAKDFSTKLPYCEDFVDEISKIMSWAVYNFDYFDKYHDYINFVLDDKNIESSQKIEFLENSIYEVGFLDYEVDDKFDSLKKSYSKYSEFVSKTGKNYKILPFSKADFSKDELNNYINIFSSSKDKRTFYGVYFRELLKSVGKSNYSQNLSDFRHLTTLLNQNECSLNAFLKFKEHTAEGFVPTVSAISEVLAKDVDFVNLFLDELKQKRDNENTKLFFETNQEIISAFEYLDKSNYKDFLSILNSSFSFDDGVVRLPYSEIFSNPVTKKFDINIYNLSQKINKNVFGVDNSVELAKTLVDSNGSISPIGIEILDIFSNSKIKSKGFVSQLKTFLNKNVKKEKPIDFGRSNVNSHVRLLELIKNSDGNFDEFNVKALKTFLSILQADKNSNVISAELLINIFNFIKDGDGVASDDKIQLVLKMLKKAKTSQNLNKVLYPMPEIPDDKLLQAMDICSEINYKSTNPFSNFKNFSEFCIDKNGVVNYENALFLQSLTQGYESVYSKNFLNFAKANINLHPFLIDVANNTPKKANLSDLGVVLIPFMDKNGNIDEELKQIILKYAKTNLPYRDFPKLYERCWVKSPNGENLRFDYKMYEDCANTLSYLNDNTRTYGQLFDVSLLCDILTNNFSFEDLTFAKKLQISQTIQNSIAYLPNPEPFKAALNSIQKSIELGDVSNPISQEAKNDFTFNVLSVKNGKYTPFEDILINSIGQLENMKDGLPLSYSREQYLLDFQKICPADKLTEISNKIGIELIFDDEQLENSAIVGYNGLIDITNLDLNNPLEKSIYDISHKFLYENSVNSSNYLLNEQLNYVLNALPEFINIVGKKQHKTHRYTLDIHSLLVMANSIANPNYLKMLNPIDKTMLKSAALLHDISKKENVVDSSHSQHSSIWAYGIMKKFFSSNEFCDRLMEFIENHHWTKAYNVPNNLDVSEEIAFKFRRPNDFEAAKIMANADIKSINPEFYDGLKFVLQDDNLQPIENNLNYFYSSGNAVFTNIFVLKSKLKNFVKTKDDVEYKVVDLRYLDEKDDVSKFGFELGLKKEDLRFLVHMTEQKNIKHNLDTLKLLSNVNNEGVLSESIISPEFARTYGNRKFGVVLFQPNYNLINISNSNQGSGYKKDVSKVISFIYDNKDHSYRKNYRTMLFKNLQIPDSEISNEEYAKFYKENLASKNSFGQFLPSKIYKLGKYEIVGDKLLQALKKTQDSLIDETCYSHNELVGYIPKIEALIAKDTDFESLPDEFLSFAQENNLPIILI